MDCLNYCFNLWTKLLLCYIDWRVLVHTSYHLPLVLPISWTELWALLWWTHWHFVEQLFGPALEINVSQKIHFSFISEVFIQSCIFNCAVHEKAGSEISCIKQVRWTTRTWVKVWLYTKKWPSVKFKEL